MQDDLDHNLVACALRAVPSHREDAKSISEIAEQVSRDTGAALEVALGIVTAVVVILDSFGVLTTGKKIRIQNQIPNYFRLSLLWYLQHRQKIFSNWNREGTARDIRVSNLLDQAAYFLKALELRREHVSRANDIELTPTRVQPVSIVLVKAEIEGRAYFLHQWDQAAERYQPIGGKGRDSETHLETAKREFREEISDNDIVYGKDYEINLVFEPFAEQEVSRTYGSLTNYEISVYQATFSTNNLGKGVSDRWISIREINNKKTDDGREVSPLCAKLNLLKPGFLDKLPYSIKIKEEAGPARSRIFVSYRRDDSAGTAGWIHEKLAGKHRRSVFKDTYDIEAAENIRTVIGRALRHCDVVVAVIGSKWLGHKDGARRIDDEHDWIRGEIELALQLGIPVVPVLVERAQMPPAEDLPKGMRSIAELNALVVDPNGDFDGHIDRLVGVIDRLIHQSGRS